MNVIERLKKGFEVGFNLQFFIARLVMCTNLRVDLITSLFEVSNL